MVVKHNGNRGASTSLASGRYDFDHIDIKGKGILRVTGAGSSLIVQNGVLNEGDGSGRLELEGTLNAPSDFIISGALVVILNDLAGPVNLTTQTNGGLELWANAPGFPNGVYSFQSLTVKANTSVWLVSYDGPSSDYGVTLEVENLTVDANGRITADGRGYGSAQGPGAGGGSSVGGGATARLELPVGLLMEICILRSHWEAAAGQATLGRRREAQEAAPSGWW